MASRANRMPFVERRFANRTNIHRFGFGDGGFFAVFNRQLFITVRGGDFRHHQQSALGIRLDRQIFFQQSFRLSPQPRFQRRVRHNQRVDFGVFVFIQQILQIGYGFQRGFFGRQRLERFVHRPARRGFPQLAQLFAGFADFAFFGIQRGSG